jgi:hypothetical protein
MQQIEQYIEFLIVFARRSSILCRRLAGTLFGARLPPLSDELTDTLFA